MSPAKATTRTGGEQARGNETRFPAWLPQMARQRIGELRATLDGPDATVCRGLLVRLAKYPVMRTEVWEKLPAEPRGIEGDIIAWAFLAYTIFPSLRRPWPRTNAKWREWAKHLEKHSPLTDPAHLSQLSHQLWEEISELKDETDRHWPSLWEGDRSINSDQVLSILNQLRAFYARMGEEYRILLDTLPKVNRWNAKSAQKFFSEYLSARMKDTYARPLDSIVMALTEVAFDLPQSLSAETVRGRRRIGGRPENSKRKSR